MAAVFLGGFLRYMLTRNVSEEEAERRREQGVLVGSGLVGGEGLTGVVLAGYAAFILGGKKLHGWPLPVPHWLGEVLALLAIAGILWLIAVFARRKPSDA